MRAWVASRGPAHGFVTSAADENETPPYLSCSEEAPMRIPSLSVAAALALAMTQPAALAASTLPVQYQQAQDNIPSSCREVTETVTIGGQPQQAVRQACRPPGRPWQITPNTPRQPTIVYT